ncbi:unnamed protein product [Symbiodinium sp. CCMP2592]|nr:unnamed protein product [Symbiodinium sp. CCMP2592]
MLAMASIAIVATPVLAQPDLVVSSVTPPPTGVEGGIVEVSWTVTNEGDTAATGNWSDSIFLSVDQIHNPEDHFIGAQPRLQEIGPGESYVQTRSVEIPSGVFGDWYFIVQVDSGFQIGEGANEDNNFTSAGTATAIEGTFPDLVVEILEVPESGLSGRASSGQLRWRVTNVGGTTAVPTSTWYDRIYISFDDQPGDDILLQRYWNAPVSSLAPGESYEQSASAGNFPYPYNINGEVRWRVLADGEGRINEGDAGGELNNNAFSDVRTVQGGDAQIADFVAPDLVSPGTRTTLTWTTTNPGPGAINDVRYSMWLSVDEIGGNGEPGEREIFSNTVYTNVILAGGSENDSRTYDIPSDVVDGEYFFVLVADPQDEIDETVSPEGENNNVFARAVGVDSNVFPDLVVEILEVPESGLSGRASSGQLRWRVTNVGGTTAVPTSTWYDRIYISFDDQPGDDILLQRYWNAPVSSLAPGESYEQSASAGNFPYPYNINGEVRWRVLADGEGRINEGDAGGELNNNAFSDVRTVQGGDAQIADFVAPDLVSPGTRTTLTWTTTNPGPGAINDVRYSMWLSVDEIGGNGEPGEREIFSNTVYTNVILAGGSENDSRTYDIPSDVVDGEYFFVLVADPQDEIDETVSPEGENNNVFARAVGVDSNVFPDLVVEILEVPESGLSGRASSGQLRWRVTNVGGTTAVPTSTWYDRIYISFDDQPGDDILLQRYWNAPVSSLAPGESYEQSASAGNFPYPYNINGEVRWRVLADGEGRINEGDAGGELNNNAFSDVRTVQGGDAQIADFVAPDLVSPGTRTTLTWTTTNPGPGAINDVRYSMWLSVDEIGGNGEPGEREIFSNTVYTNVILAGGSENDSRTYDIPSDVVDGEYFFVLVADPQDEIDETVSPEGENNNVFARAVGVDSNVFPDLVVEILEVPESGLSGRASSGQLRWRVTNVGGTTAVPTSTWYDRIYISFDDQPGDDILLQRYWNAPVSSLAPGESYEQSASAGNFPYPYNINGEVRWRVLADGEGRINEGDAGGELNNNAFSDVRTVQGGDAQIADFVAPDLVSPGTRTTLTWTTTNPGPGAINDVRYSMWLSVDEIGGNGEPGEREIFSNTVYTNVILAGGSENDSRTYDIPSDVVDGEYFFVLVADPQDEIDETVSPEGENNNVFATRPIAPDVIVSDIVIPTGVHIGDEIQLSWTLENAGTKVADGPWTDEIIFSVDEIAGNDDDVLFDTLDFLGSLTPGQQITRGISFTVPASAAKSGFMILRTDATNTVNESREDNNTRAEPFEPTGPDLFLASAGVGQSVQSLLDPISVSWATQNQGTAVALGPWVERVYLSSDAVFSPGTDLLFESLDSADDIQQGGQVMRMLDLLPPQDGSLIPGDYFVFIDLDSEAGVIEIDEGNNVSEPVAITLTEAITPDLVMVDVSGPTEVAAGGIAEITWTVENQGNGSTDTGWADSIRISLDAALGGDIELARVQRGAPLSPGSSYTETVSVVVPEEYVGNRRFVVVTDADDALNEFAGEANNAMITSGDVLVREVDLVIADISAPSAGIAGETVNISWESVNQSPATIAASSHWRDRVYLSSDMIIGGDDVEVGSIVRVGPQGANESVLVQASVELPVDLAGSHFVVIRTDADNQIAEGNAGELNNSYISGEPIEVNQPALPDLVISSISSPSTAISGESITIHWDGQNIGEQPAVGTWTDRVYLSIDPQLSSEDVLLGSDFRVGPVNASDTFVGELEATLPMVTGQRWIIVESDPDDLIEEGDGEENNSLVATSPILIEAPQLPDLVSQIVSSPTTAESGGSVIVSWQVSNTSTVDATGTWSNAVYLSDDTVLSSDDQILRAETFINGTVAGDGGISSLEFLVVMPSTLQDKTAYFIASADIGDAIEESDDANNASQAMAISISAEPSPDLIAQSVSAPSAAEFGEEIAVTISGQNIGTDGTSGGWAEQVFLSTDNEYDDNDIFVGIGFQDAALAEGDLYAIQDVSITLPLENSLLPGTYFLIVKTDAFGQVQESDEENNIFVGGTVELAYPPLPDIAVSSVMIEGEIRIGSTVSATVNLTNTGDAEVPSGSRILLALSESQSATEDSAFAALTVNETIPIGGSVEVVGNVVLPDPGFTDSYLIASADADEIVVELDELNNSGASSLFSFPRPDLVAQSVSVPSSAVAGDPINIIWEVQNNGSDVTRGAWSDRIMLSQNPDSTSGRVVLSRVIDFNVAPGTPYVQSAIVMLGDDLEGQFYVIVDADAGDTLIEEEPDSSNRAVSSSPISISRPDRPNLVVSSVTSPTSVVSGQSSDLSWRVQNIGSTSTNTIWNDRVYASRDDVLSSDDYLIAQQSAVMQLAPGQSYTRTLNAPLPLATGTYKLLVVADATSAQAESHDGGENDNLGVSVSDFTIAGYSASASASPDSGLAGTPITVSGAATVDGTGEPAAGVPVKVRGRVRGFERYYTVLTLADGSYSATLNPGPTEAGLYTIDAGMPTDESFTAQDSLVLVGLQTSSVPINVRVLPGHESAGTFTVRNLGDLPLSGFEIISEGGNPAIDVQVVFDGGSVLAPLENRTVEYRINATEEVGGVVPVVLRAVTAAGAQATTTLSITVGRESADLLASTMDLREDMVAGENDYIELEIQNIGGAESGPLEVDIAAAPWLSLVSPDVMDSLMPGEEAAVTLRLSPDEDLPLGAYEASPGIVVSDQTDPSVFEEIDFSIENTTNRRGVLDVQVTSEFSYFGEPPIYPENAVVTARSFGPQGRYARGGITASGVADANGQISFEDLPEGWYEIEVRAPGHNTYRNNQYVRGSDNTGVETFVPRQVLSFDWSVIPIDFVDEYLVTITTVFETNVPAPVVTIDTDPVAEGVQPLIDLTTGFDDHGIKEIEVVVENHGLITAENFALNIPEHSRFDVIPLIDSFGDIPGQSSFTIPILIVDRFPELNGSVSQASVVGCEPVQMTGQYEVVCGQRRLYLTYTYFRQPDIDCGTGDGGYIGADGLVIQGGQAGQILNSPEEQYFYDQLQLFAQLYLPYTLVFPDGEWFTNDNVNRAVSRWNRSISYASMGISEIQDVPDGMSTDFMTQSEAMNVVNTAVTAMATLADQGYEDPSQVLLDATELLAISSDDGQGVCVQVTVQLEQRIAITRSAFRASLGLDNPGGGGSVESIGVSLVIRDQLGNDATDLFLIEAPELEGITDVSGTGSLPEGASGRANWRIIPSDFAAPEEDTPYYISGEFQYSVDGNLIVVPLVPAEITVQPNASLDLKYFVERDVYGDDPFTPEIEPSIPYNLGLLMTNQGAGEARDVRIAAAEPRIIENDRGLIIDFDLIGTQVGEEETSPSLNIELGDLGPDDRQVARWLFTSTLQGEFVEFDAEFVSLNGFNTPEFSLIDGISIFEMDHPVRAGAYANSSTADDDALFDFLTNQMPDLNDLPDRLHQSNGAVDAVEAIDDVDATIQDSFTAEVDVTMPEGWAYIRVNDPFDANLPLQSIERSDGKVILPSFNAWQTNRIQRQGPNAGQPERYVHIFDRGGSGRYTLRFCSDATPPAVLAWGSQNSHGSFGDITIGIDSSGTVSEPRSSGLSKLQVTFDEPIDPATFQPINVIARGLDPDGNELDLGGIAVETELTPSGLSGMIQFIPALPDEAKYCITLNNVRDEAGNVLQDNAQIIVTALQGDANGDSRVNGADVAFVRAIRADVNGGLIDPMNPQHVRSDITGDGRVNGADVSFTRASNGNDTRAIADPCFLPDGLGPFRDGLDSSGSSVDSAKMSGAHNAGQHDIGLVGDDSEDWEPIQAEFTADGVSIRLDPLRFVVGDCDEGVDAIALLLDSGVEINQISMLGFSDWLLVELIAEGSAEPLMSMLRSSGVYTSPLLRDDADEFLVAQSSILIKFEDSAPDDWCLKVLETEFGQEAGLTVVSDSIPGLLRVDLDTHSGSAVIAAANRLAKRKDIQYAEPDFVMFANRVSGLSGASVDSKLITPLDIEPHYSDSSERVAGVVMIDDGVLHSIAMRQGETTFGVFSGYGQPETHADVYGQAVYKGLCAEWQGIEMASAAIRGLGSLNETGRSVSTTHAMVQSLARATVMRPKVVTISGAFGYESVLLHEIEAEMLNAGIVLIRSSSSTRTGNVDVIEGVLLDIPILRTGETGAQDTAFDAAERVGEIAAALLSADKLGGVSLVELAGVVARQLSETILDDPMSADTVIILIDKTAQRMAVDLNRDGQVTQEDLAEFVKKFEITEPSIDYDGSGQVDQRDMVEYLRRFEAYMAN